MFVALKVEEERHTIDDFQRRCTDVLGADVAKRLMPSSFAQAVIEQEITILEALHFQLTVFQPTAALQGYFLEVFVRKPVHRSS